jgi:hypothetical protein
MAYQLEGERKQVTVEMTFWLPQAEAALAHVDLTPLRKTPREQ